jgi:uncharacterized membrane protein
MLRAIRTNFITGLLVIAPLAITAYIVYRLFIWVDHLLGTTLRGGYIRPGGVPGLGFLTVLVIITVTGALANNILGRQLGSVFESMLLRVPVLRGVYATLKEVGEALLGDRKSAFQKVVLIEHPRPGLFAIGLLTGDPPRAFDQSSGKALRGVFVPTTPNFTTGTLVYCTEDQLIPTTLRVEQVVKMIVSAGVVVPPG